jgi:hypothetical protein
MIGIQTAEYKIGIGGGGAYCVLRTTQPSPAPVSEAALSCPPAIAGWTRISTCTLRANMESAARVYMGQTAAPRTNGVDVYDGQA